MHDQDFSGYHGTGSCYRKDEAACYADGKTKEVEAEKVERAVITRLLLGKKRDLFTVMKIKGKVYGVSIQPYISPEDAFKEAVNSGVFTADNLKVGD